jgi:hypothetical protein
MSNKPPVRQAPSTQAALDRSIEKDAEHFFRPDPDVSLWRQDREEMRSLTVEEINLHRDARKWRPTHNKNGVAVVSHHSNRERAIEAFMYSPPAKLTEEQEKLLAPGQVAIERAPSLPQEQEEYSWNPWLALLIRIVVLAIPLAALSWLVLRGK